jgi:aspartyl-tRNA(Asn)/glutamyl-tRNA(Gln) amidotransferase subunit A
VSAIHDLTIEQASTAMAQGKLSSVRLTEHLLERIGRLEPALRAWETVDSAGALDAARRADVEMQGSGPRGRLHGVPVGLKDIYYTAGLRTSMSSKVFRDFVPDFDCAFVERLKAAGAVVIGKTVTTEFATGDPSPTLNPWHAAHTPGGSSSGSAVAVATRSVPVASGSQTAGSVVRPAAYNGVVGLKPTYGVVSRYGVFPCSWTLDTLGWMTRSAADAAIVFDVVAGHDPRDPGSAAVEPEPAYEGMFSAEDSSGTDLAPRIGLVTGYFGQKASLEVSSNTLEAVERLKLAGAFVEPLDLPESFDGIHEAQLAIDYTECSLAHKETFAKHAGDYAPNIRSRVEAGALVPAWAYVQAQRLRRKFRLDMDRVLVGYDAIVMPSTPSPAGDVTTTGDPMFQSPWTVAGLPEITIPSGLSRDGLPMGIQLVGRGYGDAGLLRVAHWAELQLGVDLGIPPAAR